VSGCGGAQQTGAEIPQSASLAPADAVVFARFATDPDSSQWQKADSVLARIPGVRDALLSAVEQGLSEEGLDWETDVAPALGNEVVIVATAKLRPIVLLEPESDEKLDALLATSDEEVVRGEVEGRVALAEKDADLAEYRAALARGTIEDDESFVAGLRALPEESLGLVWVDMSVLTDDLSSLFEEATQEKVELGIDWLSASFSAEDDGMLIALGMRTPDGATRTTSRRSSAACPPMPSQRSPSAEPRARSTGSRVRSTWMSSRARSKRQRACHSMASSTRSPERECSTCARERTFLT